MPLSVRKLAISVHLQFTGQTLEYQGFGGDCSTLVGGLWEVSRWVGLIRVC
jgi:hypothetical protein